MVYKFYDEKSREVVLPLLLQVNLLPNQIINFANEFHRQIIKKFKRRKVYSSIRDNI